MKLPLSGSVQREITITSHSFPMKNAESLYEKTQLREEGRGSGVAGLVAGETKKRLHLRDFAPHARVIPLVRAGHDGARPLERVRAGMAGRPRLGAANHRIRQFQGHFPPSRIEDFGADDVALAPQRLAERG